MSTTNLLMDVQSLAAALSPGLLLIVDCRFSLSDPDLGKHDFLEGHVPGAVYASLDHDLSDLSRHGLGRHPLPDPSAFEQTLSDWGWHSGLRVVAYDAAGSAMAAARLWWMLTNVGITATVLDGGWQAWQVARLPMETGAARVPTPTQVALHVDTSRAADYEEIEKIRLDPASLIVDARDAPRFRGDVEPIDRVAGHVPGTHHRPFSQNLSADGRFKPAATLRAEFDTALAGRAPSKVVHMCGSGVYACHNLLAMEIAGLDGSRAFVPSWSGWSSDPSRPVATGDA